jgi:hypothetical protein
MTIEDIFGENIITGNGVNVTYGINEQGYTVVTISNFTGATQYDTVSGKYVIDIGWITNP